MYTVCDFLVTLQSGSLKSMSEDVPRNAGGLARGLQTSRRKLATSQGACKLAKKRRQGMQGACKRPE